jgi:hypothetical protein
MNERVMELTHGNRSVLSMEQESKLGSKSAFYSYNVSVIVVRF